MPLAQVSLLHVENRFHPLLGTDGEEHAWRIIGTLHALVVNAPLAPIKHKLVTQFHVVCGRLKE